MDDALRITQSGLSTNVLTSGLGSTPFPLDSSGNAPRHVLIQAEATGCYIKPHISNFLTTAVAGALTATLNDVLVPTSYPLVLHTQGLGRFSAISRTGSGIFLNIIPVEE